LRIEAFSDSNYAGDKRENLLLTTALMLEIISLLGVVKSRMLCLISMLKQSIELWLIQLVTWCGWNLCCENFDLVWMVQNLCPMTTRLLFT